MMGLVSCKNDPHTFAIWKTDSDIPTAPAKPTPKIEEIKFEKPEVLTNAAEYDLKKNKIVWNIEIKVDQPDKKYTRLLKTDKEGNVLVTHTMINKQGQEITGEAPLKNGVITIHREDDMGTPPFGKHHIKMEISSKEWKSVNAGETSVEYRNNELDPELENLTPETQKGNIGETQTFKLSSNLNAPLEIHTDLGPNYTVSDIQYVTTTKTGKVLNKIDVTPSVEGKYSLQVGTPRSTQDAYKTQSITLNGEAIDVTKLPVTIEMVPEKEAYDVLWNQEVPTLNVSGKNLQNIKNWKVEAVFTEPITNETANTGVILSGNGNIPQKIEDKEAYNQWRWGGIIKYILTANTINGKTIKIETKVIS